MNLIGKWKYLSRSKYLTSMFCTLTYHFQYRIWEGKYSSAKTSLFFKVNRKLHLNKEIKTTPKHIVDFSPTVFLLLSMMYIGRSASDGLFIPG